LSKTEIRDENKIMLNEILQIVKELDVRTTVLQRFCVELLKLVGSKEEIKQTMQYMKFKEGQARGAIPR